MFRVVTEITKAMKNEENKRNDKPRNKMKDEKGGSALQLNLDDLHVVTSKSTRALQ